MKRKIVSEEREKKRMNEILKVQKITNDPEKVKRRKKKRIREFNGT